MTNPTLKMPTDWGTAIAPYIEPDKLQTLFANVTTEYQQQSILPQPEKVFNALEKTSYKDVKVVILGQDPYPTKGHAMGMSFSVPNGIPIARSLANIYKERETDLGIPVSSSGDLTYWAQQGVLLLNTVLTVREGQPDTHKGIGWQDVTVPIIKSLNDSDHPIVYILWGRKAQVFKEHIDLSKHYVIESSHPSPLGATKTAQPFIGSRCFSRTNTLLEETGQQPVDWNTEKKYNGCAHCVPNKSRNREPLHVNNVKHQLPNGQRLDVIDFISINRAPSKTKRHYLMSNRIKKLYAADGTMLDKELTHRQGIDITHCPTCGRCFKETTIDPDHPRLQSI